MKRTEIGAGETKLPVTIFADDEILGCDLAGVILERIGRARHEGRTFLLGCPGGRSARSTYQALGDMAAQAHADFSNLVIVMMDEYVLPKGNGFKYPLMSAHYSCRRFARDEILKVLNFELPAEKQLPKANVWHPAPKDPAAFDTKIKEAGGIDLFILASGASDGHVAFNPPGSPVDSASRIVELNEGTRQDNLGTFPEFKSIDEVPTHGVTIGIGSIAALSKEVVLVIQGAHKADSVRRIADCKTYDPNWPVSVVYLCKNPRVFLDAAAAGGLA